MKYMLLINHGDDLRSLPFPPALGKAIGDFMGGLQAQGKFVDGEGLAPTNRGKRFQLGGGKMTVIDGPFAESKELVGGYMIIEAASDEEAFEIVHKFMDLHREHWPEFTGGAELRPLQG
jgi:hypothetical protein